MQNQITVARTFDAPPQVLYDVWVASSTLVAPVTSASMDPVVGGAIHISTGAGAEYDLQGVFIAVAPAEHLRYTWRWGGSPEESLIDVFFHQAANQTVVEVVHGGFLDDASLQTHLSGWTSYFDGIEPYVAAARSAGE